MRIDPWVLTAVGADAPKGVGAFEASGGYPEVLVEDWTATDVSAFDAPAPTLLNENGCGDLEDAGGYIVAGAFVTSLAGERSELLGFADGAANEDVDVDWEAYPTLDDAASVLPSFCVTLEKENGFGALEVTGG